MKRLWHFFLRFLRHRRALVLGMLCVPLMSACDIGLTLIVGDAIDHLRAQETEFLPRFFLLLMTVAVLGGVFRYFQRWWIVGVSRRFEIELKQELFDDLTHLSFAFHDRNRSGDIVSRMTSDVENLRMMLGPGLLMYVLNALVIVPGSLVVLLTIAPGLTLAMTLPLALVAVTMKGFAGKLHTLSTRVQESLADIAHRAQESFAGIRVGKGYGLAEHEAAAFTAISAENRTHQIDLSGARGMTQALIGLSHNLAFLPILFVGGVAMIDRTIDAGDLFKFLDLANKAFWPVIALGWMAGLIPRAIASAERVDYLLEERSEIEEPERPVPTPEPRGALSLRGVGYSYPGSTRPAVQGVTVDVPAGSVLGVVGPTGSGKSTLLSLLGRFHAGRGEIRLDGAPIQDLPLADLRRALGYVPQDSFLFSETYRYNVAFGTERELEDRELRELIDQAGMTEEVAAFPEGLDQVLGERGVTLSGGQRQRTCIARALAKDPRILILDDALSAVDTETEARLLANLERAGQGRTVIVAAHRIATVKDADCIVLLREGRVEAQGTHAELLERSDWYRATWERQRMLEELESL